MKQVVEIRIDGALDQIPSTVFSAEVDTLGEDALFRHVLVAFRPGGKARPEDLAVCERTSLYVRSFVGPHLGTRVRDIAVNDISDWFGTLRGYTPRTRRKYVEGLAEYWALCSAHGLTSFGVDEFLAACK